MSWGKHPDEVAKLREREFDRIKRREGEIPGFFKFYIESNGDYVTRKTKDYELITASINDSEKINCFIYNERKQVARHIQELTEKLIDGVPKYEYIKSRSGVFDSDPYLSLETQFIDQGGELKLLKIISTRYKRRQITCLNDSMGYVDSFRRVVADFIASINDGELKSSQFEQVSFVSTGKNRFGYQQDVLTNRKGGGDLLRNEYHQLKIEAPTKVEALDQVVLQAVDQEFKFKELLLEKYLNGRRVKLVTIQPDGENTFAIDVVLKGKGIQGSYPLKSMTSNLRFEKLIYKKLTDNKTFQDLTFWPTHDYITPQPTTFSFQKWVKGSKYIKVQFGKSTEIWRYNKAGQVDLKIIDDLESQVVHKRAYLRGGY